ncbi:VOC family protein [Phenylobacterium sp.]|uniref:VOC family protein n=1 Tax=Phenylobacterium sp. TaxID=1871053 RepID=UPI0027369D36|nr:VOC family protein [Phenylobacterium sp.]MDP3659277.1 VOC family protein [Phenylobacterium sp.]
MLSYVTIGALDAEVSNRFYDAVLGAIGWKAHADNPGWRGYSLGGQGEGQSVWVCQPFNGEPASVGNGSMVAFEARSQAEVHAFFEAAMANGGSDDGAPGPRPDYGPNWYATYLRDPVGNKLAAVFFG